MLKNLLCGLVFTREMYLRSETSLGGQPKLLLGNQEIESSGDHTDLISSTGNSGCTNQNDNKGNSHHASNTTAEERNGMMRYSIFFVLSHALVDGIGMATMVQDYSTFVCQVLERRKRKLPVFVDEGWFSYCTC